MSKTANCKSQWLDTSNYCSETKRPRNVWASSHLFYEVDTLLRLWYLCVSVSVHQWFRHLFIFQQEGQQCVDMLMSPTQKSILYETQYFLMEPLTVCVVWGCCWMLRQSQTLNWSFVRFSELWKHLYALCTSVPESSACQQSSVVIIRRIFLFQFL